jgi:hypothetical protein
MASQKELIKPAGSMKDLYKESCKEESSMNKPATTAATTKQGGTSTNEKSP